MHSMFRARFGVPHLFARELLMNSPHCYFSRHCCWENIGGVETEQKNTGMDGKFCEQRAAVQWFCEEWQHDQKLLKAELEAQRRMAEMEEAARQERPATERALVKTTLELKKAEILEQSQRASSAGPADIDDLLGTAEVERETVDKNIGEQKEPAGVEETVDKNMEKQNELAGDVVDVSPPARPQECACEDLRRQMSQMEAEARSIQRAYEVRLNRALNERKQWRRSSNAACLKNASFSSGELRSWKKRWTAGWTKNKQWRRSSNPLAMLRHPWSLRSWPMPSRQLCSSPAATSHRSRSWKSTSPASRRTRTCRCSAAHRPSGQPSMSSSNHQQLSVITPTLKLLNSTGHLDNPDLHQEMVERLPSHLSLAWGEHVSSVSDSSLQVFADWLSGKANWSSFSNIYSNNNNNNHAQSLLALRLSCFVSYFAPHVRTLNKFWEADLLFHFYFRFFFYLYSSGFVFCWICLSMRFCLFIHFFQCCFFPFCSYTLKFERATTWWISWKRCSLFLPILRNFWAMFVHVKWCWWHTARGNLSIDHKMYLFYEQLLGVHCSGFFSDKVWELFDARPFP